MVIPVSVGHNRNLEGRWPCWRAWLRGDLKNHWWRRWGVAPGMRLLLDATVCAPATGKDSMSGGFGENSFAPHPRWWRVVARHSKRRNVKGAVNIFPPLRRDGVRIMGADRALRGRGGVNRRARNPGVKVLWGTPQVFSR